MKKLDHIQSRAAYMLRARRVHTMQPGSAVQDDGAVAVANGRVTAVGPWAELRGQAHGLVEDLGEVSLLPGLVNAHTHLELSHLSPPPVTGQGFFAWVSWLVGQPLHAVTSQDIARALSQVAACGTAAVADVATRRADLVGRALDTAAIGGVVQHELIGYGPDQPLPEVSPERLALAGHALYSTSPQKLVQAKAWDQAHGRTFSLHLAEHEDELELLATGRGRFGAMLKKGLIPADFTPPGLTPTAWAARLGLLDARTLAVHCVHMTSEDVALLAASGTTVCLCPRSNHLIGVGRAPVERFLEAAIPCCLGTDSLASVENLNLFDEMRFFLSQFQAMVRPWDVLAMVTLNPAKALGLEGVGVIAPGAPARFAILPPDLESALGD